MKFRPDSPRHLRKARKEFTLRMRVEAWTGVLATVSQRRSLTPYELDVLSRLHKSDQKHVPGVPR